MVQDTKTGLRALKTALRADVDIALSSTGLATDYLCLEAART